jgi:hypothetical protein
MILPIPRRYSIPVELVVTGDVVAQAADEPFAAARGLDHVGPRVMLAPELCASQVA